MRCVLLDSRPGVVSADVSEPRVDEASDVVERRCAVKVRLNKLGRVVLALVGGKAVDGVALEGKDLAVLFVLLRRAASWLAVLPCDATDACQGDTCAPHDDDGHLEDQLKLRLEMFLAARWSQSVARWL